MNPDSTLLRGSFERDTVLILGNTNLLTEPFEDRNLLVRFSSPDKASDFYRYCRAVVVVSDDLGFIESCVQQLLPAIVNHGIALRIVLHSSSKIDKAYKQLSQETIANAKLYLIDDLVKLAEFIARYSPGPPDSDVVVEGDSSELNSEQLLLLRRSFYDCNKIHVERITGGKDSSHLLKVHAWQRNSEVKSSLLPFFVKISAPDKIRTELDNYRIYTDLYISFQCRPNCRIERCVFTSNNASLVGNFVEDAVPLVQSLQNQHSTGIIFSLFEKTLKGFRRQPYLVSATEPKGNLSSFVMDRVWVEKLADRTDVLLRAQEMGLQMSVVDLNTKLFNECSNLCFTSPIHGDMHSGNIMVRGSDAIVIDFSAIKPTGPLTADPATLEVSLSFNLVDGYGQIIHDGSTLAEVKSFFEKWKVFINEVYEPSKLLKPLSFTDKVGDEFQWLRRAIRELRHIMLGCDCCKFEIEAIIACYLMRIARLTPPISPNSSPKEKLQFDLHVYALVTAERIIKFL